MVSNDIAVGQCLRGTRCYTEIDLSQTERNFLAYKNALPQGFEIIAVVKADAYGHGDVAVADMLSHLGVRFFAVATLEEGIRLRKNGINGEILILGYTSPEYAERIYAYGLTQALVDEFYAKELASATDRRLKAQYAIDTGMRRIGLDSSRPDCCAVEIRKAAGRFDLNGLFTHLSAADGAEERDEIHTREQIERFSAIAHMVEELRLPFVHCLNTAGGLRYNELPRGIGKYVRLGISLYGLAPSESTVIPEGIAPALSWYATVASVRAVRKGEAVGYGFGYVSDTNRLIATVTVGYADGYSRAASNRACVLINGKRAPLLGRVCMDQIMVDISGIDHVRAGDRAVLIGRSGDESITADELGKMLGTIGYEVVCGISSRVERRYI